jgi:hypothetical protein
MRMRSPEISSFAPLRRVARTFLADGVNDARDEAREDIGRDFGEFA